MAVKQRLGDWHPGRHQSADRRNVRPDAQEQAAANREAIGRVVIDRGPTGENSRPSDDRPARIGPYAIERKLGEGGMGVVYAARDERLQRTIALKTLSSLAQDPDARKRFWREARAAASV